MKLTYFGHSAYQIDLENTTILVDPFFTGNRFIENLVDPSSLHPDVILLTHAHGDHWGDTPEIAMQSGALVIGTFEITQYIQQKYGHENAYPMNTGGTKVFDWGTIALTYARHSSSFPDGHYGGTANGIILRAEGKTVYNTGDTCPFAEMSWIGEEENIDLCLMPIGDNFTMGPKDAVRAARMIQPRLTVPLHFNTFPYIEIDVGVWESAMESAGLAHRVLPPNGTLIV